MEEELNGFILIALKLKTSAIEKCILGYVELFQR